MHIHAYIHREIALLKGMALFSFAFAMYFLALYVYGIKFSKKKKEKKII